MTGEQGELMKHCIFVLLLACLPAAAPAFAAVNVSSPLNSTTVSTSAQYIASATTSCKQGVAAMGVYVDDQLQYVGGGATLNKNLQLPIGSHTTYIQAWDNCGGTTGSTVNVTATNQSGVYVALPTANSSVGSSVNFVASATTSCAQGVAAMGIYINNQLAAVTKGTTLNRQLTLNPGVQQAVVQSWDNCGNSYKQPVDLMVQNQLKSPIANTFKNIQAVENWNQWGELAPVYDICDPCAGINWNMTQNVSSTSLSGHATRFDIGGSAPYGDVLWSNKLIGQATTENLPDTDRSILPNVRNLQYDADIFVTNTAVTQDLEFDVNIFMDGIGMEWGTECNNLDGSDWDVWDNVNVRWVSTGAPCNLMNNAWNHVTIVVQRLSDNSLLYKTITLNGVTAVINRTYPPFSVPQSWYGMTVNYQMDGDYKLSPNVTYLDNLSVSYW